ncbi:MAG: hypothetical protein GFGODING_00720 [Flavobacteriales bacterium]|nr:hypothetical protein [Flavobacteriales bacterium]
MLVAQPCMVTYTYTATPPPVNGTYAGGQSVTFCFTVTYWNTTSSNWFHGVVPIPGPGWDLSTLTPGPPPATCGPSTGTWNWYATCTGTAFTAIGTVGPGFFFDLNNDGNPGNNFGDYCNGATNWQFCWTVSVASGVDCVDGADLSMMVNTYGDSETGAWSSAACSGDAIASSAPATAACCVAEAGNDAALSVCDQSPPVDLFALLGGTAQTGGTWTDPLGNPMTGMLDPATGTSGGYVYEVIDGNGGCSDQATVTVTISPQPTAGTSTTIALCSDGNPTDLLALLGPTADPGGTWSGPGPLTGNLFDPATGTADIYTYSLTGTPPCVDAQATVDVQLSLAPTAGTGGSVALCNTSPPVDLFLELGGTPNIGGVWTDPNGQVHGGVFDPATDPPGVYTYTVAGVAPCNDASAAITVTVDPVPDAGVGGAFTICTSAGALNLFTQLTGTPQAGGTWTDPNGQVFGGTYTPGISTDGNYTYTVGTGPPCGTATATLTMTAELAPDAGADGAVTICAAGGITDLFTILGGTPQAGGAWTDPNGAAFSGPYDPVLHGPGTYTYTVAGGVACPADMATVQVTEVNQPDAGTDVTVSLCDDLATADLFLLLGGTPDPGGTWTDPLGQPSTGVIVPGTATAGTYTYTLSAPSPCISATADVDLTLVPAPPTGQTAALTACTSAAPVDLLSLLSGLPSTGSWTDPNGAPMNGTLDPAIAAAGNYTYTLPASPPCTDGTHTVTVTLMTPPDAGAPGNLSVCADGAPTSLWNALGGSPDAGGTWTDPNGTSHGTNYDPVNDDPGSYLYVVAGVGPCVADSAVVTVSEVLPPQAGTSTSFAVCAGDPAFDPFGMLGGTPDPGGTWTGPGGSAVSLPIDPASATSGPYTYTVAGTAPCPAEQAVLTLTIDALPQAGVDGALVLCASQSATDMTPLLGAAAQAGGQWTAPNGTPVTSIIDPSVAVPGTYQYTVQGLGMCAGEADTADVHVAIATQPVLLATAVPASGCAPLTVTLVPQYGSAVVGLTWLPGDGAAIAQNGPVDHTYVQPGVYTPLVQYTDTAGCLWETAATTMVTALPPPNVAVELRRTVVPLDDAVVEAWTVGDVCSHHLWSVDGIPVDTTLALIHRFMPPVAGHHPVCVVATDSLGCAAEACALVLVDDVLVVHVPNTFTPNGDGINDSFVAMLVGADAKDFGFWIFDRWGEEVFHATEPGVPWTGSMKGSDLPAPDGVYSWRMKVRDAFTADRREYFGHVTLLK